MLLTVLLDVGGSSFWPGVLPEIYVVFFAGGCFAKWTVARVLSFTLPTSLLLLFNIALTLKTSQMND